MSSVQHDALDGVVAHDDDEDDDYEPPVPVRVETRLDTCPACGKPMKQHGALELLRCHEALDDDEEDEDSHTYGHTWATAGSTPAPNSVLDDRPILGPPKPPKSEYDRWQDEIKGTVAPAPPTPSAPVPHVLDPDWQPAPPPAVDKGVEEEEGFDVTAPIEQIDYLAPLPPTSITTADGVLDLEQLAMAMRNVVLRERDDVIKRGGPLERQNLELKERLADQIEQTQMWRQRAQAALTRANSLQAQYDNLVKENRKKRSQQAQQRSGEGAKAVREIKEIIKIVNRLDGWTVKMQGNGHYRFEKDGVFVTDAASSGGSQQVNMATIVKLRKAGVRL